MTATIPLADDDNVTSDSVQNHASQTNQDPPYPTHWLVAFATALSGTGRGFQINPDNTSGAWADLKTLATSGLAFAVRPDRRFLVVDLDVKGLPPHAAQLRQVAFDRLRWAVSRSQIAHLVVHSGRPGHKHLILVLGSAAPSVRDAIERQCRDAGLDVRSRGVRPPLSPHRSGAASVVSGPLDEAYAALTAKSPTRAQLTSLAQNLGIRTLSRRMERVLREGHLAGGYESPSNGRMAFALACVGSGRGREYIRTALLDPQNSLGETFRAKKPAWQEAEVERLWSLALARQGTWPAPRIVSRAEALERVARWNSSLDCDDWKGTSGGTDKAVCEAIARIAHSQGGVDFAAGLAIIAVGAGVCEATARTSLQRIQNRGWLKVVEAHTPTTATRYRLVIPESFRLNSDRMTPETPQDIDASTGLPFNLEPQDDLGNDVARWKAIGKPTMLAWRILDDVTPKSVESVAEGLKISRTAARLRLRKLQQYGLASCSDRHWTRSHVDLDRLAVQLGTSGKRTHQVERLLARRQARNTLRKTWSSAYKWFCDNSQQRVVSYVDLPDWVRNSVPPRIIDAWRKRLSHRLPRPT